MLSVVSLLNVGDTDTIGTCVQEGESQENTHQMSSHRLGNKQNEFKN